MVDSVNDKLPFHKLRFDKYMTLEVLMYVKLPDVYEFMFAVNKPTRAYLKHNYIAL